MPLIFPAPHERPSVLRARAAITAVTGAALTTLAAEIAAKIRRDKLRQRREDDDDAEIDRQADEIVQQVDMSPLRGIITGVGAALSFVALDQVGRTLARLGDLAAIEPDAARGAVAMAHDRAAALVGMKPNPKWSITTATRDMLRETIAKGIAENQTTDQIADSIVTSTGFSESRARLIATTEVSAIDNGAALSAFRTARDNGNLSLKKIWVCGGDDPCQDCLDNEAAGAIGLDDDFPDGSDSPPSHPSCYCGISASVMGDD
jgi:hypothetical protein